MSSASDVYCIYINPQINLTSMAIPGMGVPWRDMVSVFGIYWRQSNIYF